MQPASTTTSTPGSIGASPGTRVRRRGRRARADERLERDALGSAFAEAPLDPPRELALGPTAEALLRERREDLVGERARAPHRRDLLGVLHRAQALDEARGRNGVDPGVDERAVERVWEVLLLELDPPPGEELADRRDQPARGLDDVDTLRGRARGSRSGSPCTASRRPSGSTRTAAFELCKPVR